MSFNKRTVLDADIMLSIHEAYHHNSNGEPVLLITHFNTVVYADASARKLTKHPTITNAIQANALVVESPLSKMIAQYAIR